VDWLVDKIENSKSGLLEYQRMNPKGFPNLTWKDSEEFYMHDNGQMANHDAPISSIELQGLAYDALMLASELLENKVEKYRELAKKIQSKTFEMLWLDKREYFALGTDFDQKGKLRVIKTETANPAELLDSMIFDDLPEEEKKKYLCGIAKNIMGAHFLTDAGIRSRGLNERNLVPFWDYHGSYTTWPKETYDIAKGLRRQGFDRLALELENRLLNVVRALKSYPEFLYVDYRGRVLGATTRRHHYAHIVLVKSTDTPEAIQAWTVSAIVAINSKRKSKKWLIPNSIRILKKSPPIKNNWQYETESEILSHIPHVAVLKTMKELSARYPSYPYQIKGSRVEKYLQE
jgi:glycogen debranching enzyme